MTPQKREFIKKKLSDRFQQNLVIRSQIDVESGAQSFVSISAMIVELFWKNSRGQILPHPSRPRANMMVTARVSDKKKKTGEVGESRPLFHCAWLKFELA